jgi:GNAT superfamily N-acetyltransferase
MSNQNSSWENVTPSYEQTEENFFQEWAFFEQKFGEFGEPGFSEQTLPARFPGIFGHNDSVDVRFTLYRGEGGELLGVHGCYIDNGIQKPFIINVHPDHQRQGIGTLMADYIIARYKDENNSEFTYEESWRNVIYTQPSANFANKYATNVYSQGQ